MATVSEDLQALIAGWQRTAGINISAHIATEFEKINYIEVEAWAAYENSKKPRRSASARKVTSVVDGKPVESTVTAATEVYPVTGNEKFLARVAWCVDERIKLFGLAKGDLKDDEEKEKYPTTFTGWMALELRKREAISAAQEDAKTDIGWGHQIRNYVLAPYQLVKDLRTGVEKGNPDAVLDGDLDEFMAAALAARSGATRSEASAQAR